MKLHIGHRFFAYVCAKCHRDAVTTFSLMGGSSDSGTAKEQQDALFERILNASAHGESVIERGSSAYEQDIQEYFYHALQRGIRCGEEHQRSFTIITRISASTSYKNPRIGE